MLPMKHFIIVLLAGIVTFTLILIIYRPDVLEAIWLWIIGLIGPIIGSFQLLIEKVQDYLKKFNTSSSSNDT